VSTQMGAGIPAPAALQRCLDLDALEDALPELQARFPAARPYPHVVVDALLRDGIAEAAGAAFPGPEARLWTHYRHVNEDKLGSPRRAQYPRAVEDVVAALQTPAFVSWLSRLTGVPGLFPDPALEGAGMHRSGPGGFLHVHTDFQRHHHHPSWRRTVNLILFLNPDWDPRWGGAIELWTPDMRRCGRSVQPLANHAVIFQSDERSFHGHPGPLRCPPDRARKSLALYYYTRVGGRLSQEYSRFAPRPGDGLLKRAAMRADNDLVRAFSALKRRGAATDAGASRVLGHLGRWLRGGPTDR